MPCPDRLAQWKHEVSTAFGQFAQTASVGSGALERGDRADGNRRDHANQCSARVGVGPAGTSGVSTPARVVSGCEAQKRKKAVRSGRDHLLRTFVAMDRAFVGQGEPANGAGAGCHQFRRALDDFIYQRRDPQLRHPGSLESTGRT